MKTNTLLAVAIIVSFLIGCKKDAVEGPRGPQGNANVHSQTFTVNASDWYYFLGWSNVDIQVPFITDDIIATGAVLVYEKSGSLTFAMPYTANGVDHRYIYYSGTVSILHTGTSTPSTTFEVVAISSSGMIPTDLDVTNYDKVKAYFKLDDK